ncbi:hypothetical protein EVAR_49364_1 [Eumeta japonica]|uniref:Uncharacterized protein n=1 Tax=Eumeta variegata TaxID=151549 RepID=A0A4C1XWE1_EUMVA|nr:hypothetical protein EVAR_49364_1 [Eumeta japonica]
MTGAGFLFKVKIENEEYQLDNHPNRHRAQNQRTEATVGNPYFSKNRQQKHIKKYTELRNESNIAVQRSPSFPFSHPLILRHCDAFVANFKAVKFHVLYCTCVPEPSVMEIHERRIVTNSRWPKRRPNSRDLDKEPFRGSEPLISSAVQPG